ncbi:MAG TPA: hypothetical protein VFD66_05075 [Verrucomicrobiae bacterium]|nr:hypothetical protein [Verrucomicrobiae bacterium]
MNKLPCCAAALAVLALAAAADPVPLGENPLALPPPGAHLLRVLTPTLLELTLVTTIEPGPANAGPPSPIEWERVPDLSRRPVHRPVRRSFSEGGRTGEGSGVGVGEGRSEGWL